MTTINVRWFGPYQIEDCFYKELALSKGIYAIYRMYCGKETLIYIGKTRRSFLLRITEHNKKWLWRIRGQLKIRFGILEYPNGARYSEKKLSDVESLLILWHSPIENTMSTVFYTGRFDLEIINSGRRGAIDKKVSAKDLVWA